MKHDGRRISRNAHGNINGYIGRAKAYEFGLDDIAAAYWLLTGIIDALDGYGQDWFQKCRKIANEI